MTCSHRLRLTFALWFALATFAAPVIHLAADQVNTDSPLAALLVTCLSDNEATDDDEPLQHGMACHACAAGCAGGCGLACTPSMPSIETVLPTSSATLEPGAAEIIPNAIAGTARARSPPLA
ncbi:MAG: hypothetical protein GDA49_10945 [Rhodospirillales bacterium]|nr:hypothetical protein [Rhodospirillales bacterium]